MIEYLEIWIGMFICTVVLFMMYKDYDNTSW